MPDEIVLCDDGSTDATVTIAKAFATRTRFPVEIVQNVQRLGSSANFEQAIRLTRYDIVFLSDQDDVWHPKKLVRMMARFEREADLGALFSDATLVDENLVDTGRTMFDALVLRRLVLQGGQTNFFEALLRHQFVTGATMAVRREIALKALPVPRSDYFIHDGWLALAIAGMARLDVIDSPLVSYRQHNGQQVGIAALTCEQGVTESKALIHYPTRRDGYLRFHQELAVQLASLPLQRSARDSIAEVIRHDEVRMTLPTSVLLRIAAVLREWPSGRYSRFSSGWRSVAADIIRCPTT